MNLLVTPDATCKVTQEGTVPGVSCSAGCREQDRHAGTQTAMGLTAGSPTGNLPCLCFSLFFGALFAGSLSHVGYKTGCGSQVKRSTPHMHLFPSVSTGPCSPAVPVTPAHMLSFYSIGRNTNLLRRRQRDSHLPPEQRRRSGDTINS